MMRFMEDGPILRRIKFGDGVSLTGSSASILGTDITITSTSSGDLSAGVFGVEMGIGRAAGYVFAWSVPGAAANQSITIGAGEGIAANDIVNVRCYYNVDVLDDPSTRVYGSEIVPDLGTRGAPTGTPTSGQQLTLAASTEVAAAGASAMTISRQWQRSTDASFVSPAGTNIGTDSDNYTLTDSEIGSYVRVVSIETNSAGSASVNSSATAIIAAAVDDIASLITLGYGTFSIVNRVITGGLHT